MGFAISQCPQRFVLRNQLQLFQWWRWRWQRRSHPWQEATQRLILIASPCHTFDSDVNAQQKKRHGTTQLCSCDPPPSVTLWPLLGQGDHERCEGGSEQDTQHLFRAAVQHVRHELADEGCARRHRGGVGGVLRAVGVRVVDEIAIFLLRTSAPGAERKHKRAPKTLIGTVPLSTSVRLHFQTAHEPQIAALLSWPSAVISSPMTSMIRAVRRRAPAALVLNALCVLPRGSYPAPRSYVLHVCERVRYGFP